MGMRYPTEGVRLSNLCEIDASFFSQTQIRVFSWFDKILVPLTVLIEIVALYYIQESALYHVKKWALSAVVFLAGIAFYWFWVIDGSLYWWTKKKSRYQTRHEEALMRKRIAVYERLRYIENEQIIFDPVSGEEQRLATKNITQFIDKLAMRDLFR